MFKLSIQGNSNCVGVRKSTLLEKVRLKQDLKRVSAVYRFILLPSVLLSNQKLLKQMSFFSPQLLAPDIRHERNVILQCLRYIVKKHFFGVGDTSVSEDVVNK